MFVAETDGDLVFAGCGGQVGHGDGAVLVVVTADLRLAGALDGHGQAPGARALRGDGEVGRFTADAVSQARAVRCHIAGTY